MASDQLNVVRACAYHLLNMINMMRDMIKWGGWGGWVARVRLPPAQHPESPEP